MNPKSRIIFLISLTIIVLFVLGDTFFIVSEMNQVIITQFGEPVSGTISKPGIHTKLPFVQDVHSFEKRWLEWEGDSNQIPTKDKKYIWVETYARWRIHDPLVFFQRVRDERGGQSRLDDIIDGETRNAIANFDLIEIVRSSNRKFEASAEVGALGPDVNQAVSNISTGRVKIAALILKQASKITPEFGVELKDVRIRRVNYVDEVQQKVFERMIAERKRIAAQYRSEGDGQSAEIRGQKERELKKIQSEAYKKAQELRGKADGEASRIYAAAYGKDPEFYQFMKTMETYRKTFDDKTWFIFSTEGEFLRYLKSTEKR